jgi:hypothetical protein
MVDIRLNGSKTTKRRANKNNRNETALRPRKKQCLHEGVVDCGTRRKGRGGFVPVHKKEEKKVIKKAGSSAEFIVQFLPWIDCVVRCRKAC